MSHLCKVQQAAQIFLRGRPLFSNIKVLTATHDQVVLSFTVEQEHLNVKSILFGGFTASLIDIGGSLAIAAQDEVGSLGVSTDMHISFIRAAKLGETVRIVSQCLKKGRNLAFTTVQLYVDEKLISTGSHTKFMG